MLRYFHKDSRENERGSVMIILFTAIVLFAALGFTVSDMMRQGSPEAIGEQQAKLYANEILDYTRAMRQAIQHMILISD